MNIKVKFPNGHFLEFQCPDYWTSEQIRHFSAKNQSFYDPDAIKLYHGGVELYGNEKLLDIAKKQEQIVFLTVIGTKKQSTQPNKQLLYLEYTKNIQKALLYNQLNNTNFQPILSQMPIMGLKFKQNHQEKIQKPQQQQQQQQRRQDDRDSPMQQEIFFHFKMICYIGAFYTLFSSYFKGQNYYYLLVIIGIFYWIKYQEFKAQLRQQQQQQQQIQRQQQQEQQRDINENQQQQQQQQSQIQQQQQQSQIQQQQQTQQQQQYDNQKNITKEQYYPNKSQDNNLEQQFEYCLINFLNQFYNQTSQIKNINIIILGKIR